MADVRDVYAPRQDPFDDLQSPYQVDAVSHNRPGLFPTYLANAVAMGSAAGVVLTVRQMLRMYQQNNSIWLRDHLDPTHYPKGIVDYLSRWGFIRKDGRFTWDVLRPLQTSLRDVQSPLSYYYDFPNTEQEHVKAIREIHRDREVAKNMLQESKFAPIRDLQEQLRGAAGDLAERIDGETLLQRARKEAYENYLSRTSGTYSVLGLSELGEYGLDSAVNAAIADDRFLKEYQRKLNEYLRLHREAKSQTESLTGVAKRRTYKNWIKSQIDVMEKDLHTKVSGIATEPYFSTQMSEYSLETELWRGSLKHADVGRMIDHSSILTTLDESYVRRGLGEVNKVALKGISDAAKRMVQDKQLGDFNIRMTSTGDGYRSAIITLISKSGRRVVYDFPLEQHGSFRHRLLGSTYSASNILDISPETGDALLMADIQVRSQRVIQNLEKVVHDMKLDTNSSIARAQRLATKSISVISGVSDFQHQALLSTAPAANMAAQNSIVVTGEYKFDRANRISKLEMRNLNETLALMKNLDNTRTFISIDVESTFTKKKGKGLPWSIGITVWERAGGNLIPKTTRNWIVRDKRLHANEGELLSGIIYSREARTREEARDFVKRVLKGSDAKSPDIILREINELVKKSGAKLVIGHNIHEFDSQVMNNLFLEKFMESPLGRGKNALPRADTLMLARMLGHDVAPHKLLMEIERRGLTKNVNAMGLKMGFKPGRISRAHNAVFDSVYSAVLFNDIVRNLQNPAVMERIHQLQQDHRAFEENAVEAHIKRFRDRHMLALSGLTKDPLKVQILTDLHTGATRERIMSEVMNDLGISLAPGRGFYTLMEPWKMFPGFTQNDPARQSYQILYARYITESSLAKLSGKEFAGGRTLPYISTNALQSLMMQSKYPTYFAPVPIAYIATQDAIEGAGLMSSQMKSGIEMPSHHRHQISLYEFNKDPRYHPLKKLYDEFENFRTSQEIRNIKDPDIRIEKIREHIRNIANKEKIQIIQMPDGAIEVADTYKPYKSIEPGRRTTPTFFSPGAGIDAMMTISGERFQDYKSGLKLRTGSSKFVIKNIMSFNANSIHGTDVFNRNTIKGLPIHIIAGFDALGIKKNSFGTMFESWGAQIVRKLLKDGKLEGLQQRLYDEMGIEVKRVPLRAGVAGMISRDTELVGMVADDLKFQRFMSDPRKLTKMMEDIGLVYTPQDIHEAGKQLDELYDMLKMKKAFGAPQVGKARLATWFQSDDPRLLQFGKGVYAGFEGYNLMGNIDDAGGLAPAFLATDMPRRVHDEIYHKGLRFSHRGVDYLRKVGLPRVAAEVESYALNNKEFLSRYSRLIRSFTDASFWSGTGVDDAVGLRVLTDMPEIKGLLPRTPKDISGDPKLQKLYQQELDVIKAYHGEVYHVGDEMFRSLDAAQVRAQQLGISAQKIEMRKLHAESLLTPTQLRGTIWDPTLIDKKTGEYVVNTGIRINMPTPLQLSEATVNSIYLPDKQFRRLYPIDISGQRFYYRTKQTIEMMNMLEHVEAFNREPTQYHKRLLQEHIVGVNREGLQRKVGFMPWLSNEFARKQGAMELSVPKTHGRIVQVQLDMPSLSGDVIPWTPESIRQGRPSGPVQPGLPKGQYARLPMGFGRMSPQRARELFTEMEYIDKGPGKIKHIMPRLFKQLAVQEGKTLKQGTEMWNEFMTGKRIMPMMAVAYPQTVSADVPFVRSIMFYVDQDLHEKTITTVHHLDMKAIDRDADGDRIGIMPMEDVKSYRELQDMWIRQQQIGQTANLKHRVSEIRMSTAREGAPTRFERDLVKTILREMNVNFSESLKEINDIVHSKGYNETDSILELLKRRNIANFGKIGIGEIFFETERYLRASQMLMMDPRHSKSMDVKLIDERVGRIVKRIRSMNIDIKRLAKKQPKTGNVNKLISGIELHELNREVIQNLRSIERVSAWDRLKEVTKGFNIFSPDSVEAFRERQALIAIMPHVRQGSESDLIGAIASMNPTTTERREAALIASLHHGLDPHIGGTAGAMRRMGAFKTRTGRAFGPEGFAEDLGEVIRDDRLSTRFIRRMDEVQASISGTKTYKRFGPGIKLALAAGIAGFIFTPVDHMLPDRPGMHPDQMRVGKSDLPAWARLSNPPFSWTRTARVQQFNANRFEKEVQAAYQTLPTYDNILYTPADMRTPMNRVGAIDTRGHQTVYPSYTDRNRRGLISPIM